MFVLTYVKKSVESMLPRNPAGVLRFEDAGTRWWPLVVVSGSVIQVPAWRRLSCVTLAQVVRMWVDSSVRRRSTWAQVANGRVITGS